jgi:hypothetical protein
LAHNVRRLWLWYVVLPIGRRMPLRDAAEAHVLGEKGGIGKILLLAPDSKW